MVADASCFQNQKREQNERKMAAIEEGLRLGPLYIMRRNKPSAVVLSEEEYQRLLGK